MSAGGHSSSPNSVDGIAVALVVEQRHGERTELALELVEQLVDGVLDLLGDDQLVALPRVRDAALGERRRQLGALVERPRR